MNRALFLLALAACGEPPDFTTSQGVPVFDSTHTVKVLEVEQTIAVWLKVTQRPIELLDGLELHFKAGPITSHGSSKVCESLEEYDLGKGDCRMDALGSTDLNTGVSTIMIRPCVAQGSLIHEIAHWVQYARGDGVADGKHEEPSYWGYNGSVRISKLVAIGEVCR